MVYKMKINYLCTIKCINPEPFSYMVSKAICMGLFSLQRIIRRKGEPISCIVVFMDSHKIECVGTLFDTATMRSADKATSVGNTVALCD